MTRPLLRFLYGDKRSPTRTLELTAGLDGIYLRDGGFAPGAGEELVVWSGRSPRFDGEKLIAVSQGNTPLAITYNLNGSNAADLYSIQRQIHRFFMDALDADVWLEYRWDDNLANLPAPNFGQLSQYYRVLRVTRPTWPNNLHNRQLLTGNLEEVVVNLTCGPYPEGQRQQLGICSGALPTLASGGVYIPEACRLLWPMTTEFSGADWTAQGWIVPAWGSADVLSGDRYVLEYYVDSTHYFSLYWDESESKFAAAYRSGGGAAITGSVSVGVFQSNWFNFAITKDSADLTVDITGETITNPVQIALSLGAEANLPANGYLSIAALYSSASYSFGGIIDGWRVWASDQSAYTATIAANELPIKMEDRDIGIPPIQHGLISAAPQFGNVHEIVTEAVETDRNYHCLLVPGDVPGPLEIRIDPTGTPARTYWLGRKATAAPIDPGILWMEYQGTADSGSSGGQYLEEAAGTSDFYFSQSVYAAANLADYPGEYLFLARLYVATAAVAVKPCWDLHSGTPGVGGTIYGAAQTLATNANFLLRDLGLMKIGFPGSIVPAVVRPMIFVDRTSSATVRADFLMLLPRPYCKVRGKVASPTYSAGELLIIENRRAYTYTTGGEIADIYEYSGDELTAEPNRYNYLYFANGDVGDTYDITDGGNAYAWVTPRWLLPGGAVA